MRWKFLLPDKCNLQFLFLVSLMTELEKFKQMWYVQVWFVMCFLSAPVKHIWNTKSKIAKNCVNMLWRHQKLIITIYVVICTLSLKVSLIFWPLPLSIVFPLFSSTFKPCTLVMMGIYEGRVHKIEMLIILFECDLQFVHLGRCGSLVNQELCKLCKSV